MNAFHASSSRALKDAGPKTQWDVIAIPGDTIVVTCCNYGVERRLSLGGVAGFDGRERCDVTSWCWFASETNSRSF